MPFKTLFMGLSTLHCFLMGNSPTRNRFGLAMAFNNTSVRHLEGLQISSTNVAFDHNIYEGKKVDELSVNLFMTNKFFSQK